MLPLDSAIFDVVCLLVEAGALQDQESNDCATPGWPPTTAISGLSAEQNLVQTKRTLQARSHTRVRSAGLSVVLISLVGLGSDIEQQRVLTA